MKKFNGKPENVMKKFDVGFSTGVAVHVTVPTQRGPHVCANFLEHPCSKIPDGHFLERVYSFADKENEEVTVSIDCQRFCVNRPEILRKAERVSKEALQQVLKLRLTIHVLYMLAHLFKQQAANATNDFLGSPKLLDPLDDYFIRAKVR